MYIFSERVYVFFILVAFFTHTHTHTHTLSQNTLAPAKVPSEAISKSHLDKVPVCEIHVRHDSGKP